MEEHLTLHGTHRHRRAIHPHRRRIRRLVHLTRQLVHRTRQHPHHILRHLRTTHQRHHLTSVRVARNTSVHRHIRQRRQATRHHRRNIHPLLHHIRRQVHRHLPVVHTTQPRRIIRRLVRTILLVRQPIHPALRILAATFTVHQRFLRFHRATHHKVQRRIRPKVAPIHRERHQHIRQQSKAFLPKIKHIRRPVQHIHQAVHHTANKNSKIFILRITICRIFILTKNVAKLAFTDNVTNFQLH